MELINGDCLEEMKNIPDNSVDMILTDPPYGTTACKWDSVVPISPMWDELKRIIKDDGAIVLFATQPFSSLLITKNIFQFKYSLVWQKTTVTGHLNAKRMPLRKHEDILVFGRKLTYNPQKTAGHKPVNSYTKHQGDGDCYHKTKVGISGGGSTERYPTSVLTFKTDKQKSALHPTQKPVALMEYLIKTYTNRGETVLDFTMGSGTTGVACKNLNRNFIGIELDKEYFEIAKNRINN